MQFSKVLNNKPNTLERLIKNNIGAAFVEAAMVIPFLALVLAATYEAGRGLYFYYSLSQAAYEAARVGSQLSNVGSGCYGDFENLYRVSEDSVSSSQSPHQYMQITALNVLQEVARDGDSLSEDITQGLDISSRYYEDATATSGNTAGCATTSDHNNTVAVKITKTYTPTLFPFSFTLTAEADTPFLFNTERFLLPQQQDPETRGEDPTGNEGSCIGVSAGGTTYQVCGENKDNCTKRIDGSGKQVYNCGGDSSELDDTIDAQNPGSLDGIGDSISNISNESPSQGVGSGSLLSN